MSSINSLLLIGNNKEEMLKFRSKLMLLRDVDSIMESTMQSAVSVCKKIVPDAVIIFCEDKDEFVFEICRALKADEILKNTPIVLLLKSLDEEYILTGFDAGISDYICLPARDSEVLMRVIWALQRSEIARDFVKKEHLLEELGVFDKKTGAYKSRYFSKVFAHEINAAQRYKYSLAFVALKLSEETKDLISQSALAAIINKSIRNTDILAVPEENKYYIILPKTKIKGIFTIFKRVKEGLLPQIELYAGGCEFEEGMDYKTIEYLADNALKKACKTGEKVVIADKFDEKETSQQEDWLNKMQATSKNYKLFKQAFNKKLKNVIEPVFYQAQQNLQAKYSDKVIIEQFTTESKCFFSIKNPFEGQEVILKITDIGFSKVALDYIFNSVSNKNSRQEKIDLVELDSKKLINILENLSAEYDNL